MAPGDPAMRQRQTSHIDHLPSKCDEQEFRIMRLTNASPHLLNLSFDVSEFVKDEKKWIDYKGLKEKPIFKSGENEFVILDIDYLNNKIYNGPLFDMYNQTNMANKTRFKQFPDFKSHISTHVRENIIFKGIIEKLFLNKRTIVHFDDENIDNTPDCYIRNGKKIFFLLFHETKHNFRRSFHRFHIYK